MAAAACSSDPISTTKRNKAYRGQIKAQIFESLGVALVSIASKAGEALTKARAEDGGARGNAGAGGGGGGGGGGGNIKKADDGSD